jgi:hypothetical protein
MKATGNASNHIGVSGWSAIDHRIRNKLMINCEQYVVLDFIIRTKYVEKELITAKKVTTDIGVEFTEFRKIVAQLEKLQVVESNYEVGQKALLYLGYEEDFEYLFMVFKKNPGNKAEGLKMFKRAIKVTPLRVIKQCALNYAAAKEGVEKQYFMHLSSFLNPEFKKYLDYEKKPTPDKTEKDEVKRKAEW